MTVGKQRIEELAAELDSSKESWSAWIDTNVLIELYSNQDVQKAAAISPAEVARRAKQYAGSCWMAMALCRDSVSTLSFGDESIIILQRGHDPEDSQASQWPRFILYVLGDYGFFDGWERNGWGVEQTLSGEDRDRLIGAICRRQNKPIISRDEPQKLKDWKDLKCYTPEEWAKQAGLTKDAAARMCADRLGVAGSKYLEKKRADGKCTDQLIHNVQQLLHEFNERWRYMEA